MAGYGAAQVVRGPVLSVAALLGQRLDGALGATVSLLAIFLSGLLLVAGVLPFWRALGARDSAVRVLASAGCRGLVRTR